MNRRDKVIWFQGGPIEWGLGCLLVWVVVFPTYVIARPRYAALIKAEQQDDTQPSPTPAPVTGIADELAKLDELRQRGVLTDAEFNEQKTALLARKD